MSLTLFINRVVEPRFYGILLTPPNYVTIQSLGMLFFGYFLQKLWARQSLANIAFSTSVKFSAAMILMLLAYLLIVSSLSDYHSALKVSPALIILAYLVISAAELMLSPIGLSAVTHLVSPNVVSTMMGIFYVSLGLGGFLAGKMAEISAITPQMQDLGLIKFQYYQAFFSLAAVLAVAVIFTLVITVVIKRMVPSVEMDASVLEV
jgi:POT family proton-dependent oligopeptide transporter